MTLKIVVEGAAAELRGGRPSQLSCLRVLDPKRFHNRAFRQGRWDGYIQLNAGTVFPAGLADHVYRDLTASGEQVIIEEDETTTVDPSKFSRDCLSGITLWAHQYDAALAMLKHPRGVIESPTASGKTELMAAVAQEFLVQRGWRTLVIVPRKGLARQTAARFRKYYGDAIRVGQVGDGEMSKGDVIVATSQSMIGFLPRQKKLPNSQIVRTIPGNPMLAKILDTFEVLMLDETHHASSESWYQIAMHSNACRRYGLSGTPLKNSEFSDMRMTGATGPVIFRVETQELIEKELVNFPRICMVMHPDASHPPLPKQKVVTRGRDGRLRVYYRDKEYAEAYSEGVAKSDQHNRAVVRAACWMADNNRRTLVLCRLREHFCKLSAMLEATGVRFEACWGATDTGTRDEVKRRLREGDARVILATTIFDEGEDLVGVEGLVLAEGVQVNTSALQRIGRGMRRQTGGDGYLWVVDFVPLCHRKLTEHALKRCEAYESRGYDVRLQDEWPADGDDSDLLPFKRWDAVAVA